MKKEDKIKECRFYKGESEFDGDYKNLLYWEAEKMYVEIEGTQESADNVGFYFANGLAGTDYDVPLELLACLFRMYCKGADNDPATLAIYFKKNFLANYLAQPLYR